MVAWFWTFKGKIEVMKKPCSEFSSFEMQSYLVDACKRGDPRAQFQFFREYYQEMYEISLNIVKDSCKAENITHESFLVAFEKICFFTGITDFLTWLRTFVRNRSNYSSRNEYKSLTSLLAESANDY